MGKPKLVNLRIDADLWHQAKIEAVRQNKTLQEFVADALKDKLGTEPCQKTATTNS